MSERPSNNSSHQPLPQDLPGMGLAGLELDSAFAKSASEQFFDLLDGSTVPCWEWRLHDGLWRFNRSAYQFFHQKIDSLQALLMLMSSEDGERLLTAVGGCLRDRRPFSCQVSVDISGSVRPLWFWGVALDTDDDSDESEHGPGIAGILITHPDRTNLASVHRAELLFEALFTQQLGPTCVSDCQGNLVRCNGAWAKLFDIEKHPDKGQRYNFLSDSSLKVLPEYEQMRSAFLLCQPLAVDVSYYIHWTELPHHVKLKIKLTPVKNADGEGQYMLLQYSDCTYQHQVLKTISSQDQLLASIINNTNAAITVKDLQGRYLIANQEYLQLFEASIDSVVGSTDEELFDEEVASRITERDSITVKRKGAFPYEERFTSANGNELIFISMRFPVTDDLGDVIAVGNVMTDVTQQRKIEHAIEARRSEQQLLLDSMRAIIWYLDRWGLVKTGNRQAQKAFPLDEVIGCNFVEIMPHDELGPERLREIMQVIRSGQPLFNTREEYTVNGRSFWYQVDKIPTRDSRGKVAGVMMVMNDITNQVLKEKALEESESRYRAFIESSSEAVFRYDMTPPVDTRLPLEEQIAAIARAAYLAECNQAFADLFKVNKPEKLIGLPLASSGSRNYLLDLADFVKHGYRMVDQQLMHVQSDNNEGFMQISAIGIVEDGMLTRVWGNSRDVTERQRYMKKLEYQANHDSLTKLPNRNYLYGKLKTTLQQRVRDQIVALMIIDLDRFKEINDTLGHHAGDKLLRQLGPRIEAELDDVPSVLARLGGDEFAVLLPRVRNNQQAVVVAHRLLDAICQTFDVEGYQTDISASIGIALCPDQGDDVSTLMRYADVAMYHAKSEMLGVSVYQPELDMHSPKRLALLNDLGRAIREDQLEVYFQPKIDIQQRHTCGFEALLRWHHPELGFVPPGEFVPLAEMTNLIHPMTLWVLEQSIKQCRHWLDEGYAFSVAVNLSARNLLDESLPDHVSELLERYQLPAQYLELEITESSIMVNPELAMAALEKIHDLGVELAIDDFGTGYSSLAYLKRLPVRQLKIDYSFIINMLEDKQDEIIVNSTINLAHNLGLNVIAEGVETEPHLLRLQALGCDKAQGYLMSKPMPVKEIAEWLKRGDWFLLDGPVKRSDARG